MNRPIIFLHGFGGSGLIWQWQVDYFSCRHRVMAVDLPGHGLCPWNNENLAGMAAHVRQQCEKAGIPVEEVDLVASSFGGLVALKFVELYPESVHKLVLTGSLPKFVAVENYPAGLEAGAIHKLARQCERNVGSVLDMFFRSVCTTKERESAQYSRVKALRGNLRLPERDALLGVLSILEKEDLREVLHQWHKPCLFLLGDSDPVCPVSVVEPLRRGCSCVQVEILKGVGHFPFLTIPEVFNRRVERFLS